MQLPEQVFLTRRNLLTLLSKLDRAGSSSTLCSIVKNDDTHPKYPQSMPLIVITAVEDDDYYTDRSAGPVHPIDEARIVK